MQTRCPVSGHLTTYSNVDSHHDALLLLLEAAEGYGITVLVLKVEVRGRIADRHHLQPGGTDHSLPQTTIRNSVGVIRHRKVKTNAQKRL